MLTDDPGTPEKKEFEFNTSLNSEITNQYQFSVPLLDINYGATERMQLKAEMPLLITVDESKNVSSNFGHPNIGIKYRFMDESKYHVGVSVFPQVVFDKRKEYLLPLQFEKSIGKFTLGEAVGYFFIENNSHNLLNGNLVGYKTSEKLEMMIEFYVEHNFVPVNQTDAFINYGFRYHLSKKNILLASFGTQVVTPADEEKKYFFSFVGLQSLF